MNMELLLLFTSSLVTFFFHRSNYNTNKNLTYQIIVSSFSLLLFTNIYIYAWKHIMTNQKCQYIKKKDKKRKIVLLTEYKSRLQS